MERLRVLTVNIWNRQGPWDRRLALLRAGIDALAPDLIGLQEVLHLEGSGLPNQADDIAAGLGGGPWHVHYAAAWDMGGGPMRFGNALISRWPIVAREVIALPVPTGDQGRGLLYALVDAPCGKVPVFVTHLTWQLYATAARCAQVRFIDDRARELAPTDGFPAVLMGDFNAEPDADEMRFLRGLTPMGGRGTYWNDAWLACAAGPGYTYARANPYALRTREPSRRIDYIFARGPDRALRGEPLSCQVVLDRPAEDGVWPSDHYGVLAEIQAAPRVVGQ